MRRDLTDTEHYIRSMVDHPAGSDAPGRHRPERIEEPTPLDLAQQSRSFRAAEMVMGGVAVLGVLLLVLLIAVGVARALLAW